MTSVVAKTVENAPEVSPVPEEAEKDPTAQDVLEDEEDEDDESFGVDPSSEDLRFSKWMVWS